MAGRSIFKKRKPFVPKRKQKISIFQPWKTNPKTGCLEATCILCKRRFIALDKSQIHMVAPSTGKCFYCRQHEHLHKKDDNERYNVNHAIHDERLYEQIGTAHEGRWRDRPEHIQYTFEETVIGKQQNPIPHWSCCKNTIRMPSQPGNRCPTAEIRKLRIAEEKEKEKEERYKAYKRQLHGRDKLTKNNNMPNIPASMMRTRSREQRSRDRMRNEEEKKLKSIEQKKKDAKDFEKAFAIINEVDEEEEEDRGDDHGSNNNDFQVIDISSKLDDDDDISSML